MKQIILILLLSFSVTVNAQQKIKKCTVVKTEKIGPHKIKVIKKNNCVNPPVITIKTYLKKEWDKKQRKRKKRKND
jgi:hypothetical protein|tara:strand:- start:222 stop:449 length:228 start_codon:yes stop_codon:yes gene_type:complete